MNLASSHWGSVVDAVGGIRGSTSQRSAAWRNEDAVVLVGHSGQSRKWSDTIISSTKVVAVTLDLSDRRTIW